MANFPQQVRTENLGQALQDFYDEKNKEIRGKLKEYQRSSVAGADSENFSETDYNQRELQKAYQKLDNGEEKVEIRWYEPVVERSAPPKVSMQRRSFQIEHRYGKWIKHSHDLR
jgi:hypothetical protein